MKLPFTDESPCQRSCRLVEQHCSTCGRHIDDIVGWRAMSDEERTAANGRAYARLNPLKVVLIGADKQRE